MTAGAYAIDARVASPDSGGAFHLEVDGTPVTGRVSVPNTGGWQTWETVSVDATLPAEAAVDVFWLSDLEAVLGRFGNRGYRAAQLEAAIEGGKVYLAAYGLGIGATGLTFFDDDVTAFFSPHAAGKSVMFLMAVGRSRAALRGPAPR